MENWRRENVTYFWKHESIKMNVCTTKSTLTCIRKWHGSIKSVIACYFGIWGKRKKVALYLLYQYTLTTTHTSSHSSSTKLEKTSTIGRRRQEAWHIISQRKSKVQQLQLPLELQKTWNLWLRKKGIIRATSTERELFCYRYGTHNKHIVREQKKRALTTNTTTSTTFTTTTLLTTTA